MLYTDLFRIVKREVPNTALGVHALRENIRSRVDERRDHLINAKLASDVRRIYAQFSNVKIKAGPFRVRLSHVGAGRPTITFQRGTCCNPAEISGGMRQPTSQRTEILRLHGSSDNATRGMSAMRDAARGASHVSHAA